MARMILKWRYIKAGTPKHGEHLIKYIATREGVEKCDESWKHQNATIEQQRLVRQLLRDFPEAKDSFEYQDYSESKTKYNASEFISRVIDENVDLIGRKENYVGYIAMRPRVEKLGSHGLFSQDDTPINLSEVSKTVAEHEGVVWTTVLSLRREDAARLGYDNAKAWRDMLRSQADKLADGMGIPLADLRWYAAFHNEGNHPHIHLVSYSVGKEPYMTERGLMKMKADFAHEIFRQDLYQTYVEGKDYIVSWGFGHLAELANADTYDEKYAKWNYNDLPIVPANWKYKIPKDKYSQFATIKHLMHREDVTAIINACDAGREGELIFRNIYQMAGCTKPIYRLWISSMEDSAIRQGFAELKSGKEYDNLYAAARCREWADWLVGINATRLFSVLYHRTLNVGRVVSPTLALLVQREAEIDAFKPEPFYTAELNFGSFTATSEKFKKKADAKAAISYEGAAVVKSVVSKEKSEKAPALYDLTTLQREANRQHGYTAQQTLDYVQSLYEKKLCTYPRTDSRYLTDDMASGVSATVSICATICGASAPSEVQSKQVCDSKKVTDHHAIIPTAVAGKTDGSVLPAGEREILTMIAKQVLRAVSGKYRYCETVADIAFGDTTFTAKGKTVIDMGWKAYNDTEQTDKLLPELHDGDELNVKSAEVKEGMTKPPAHFTEDALLSAMEVAGAKEMPDDAERKGLGTPAIWSIPPIRQTSSITPSSPAITMLQAAAPS